MNLSEMTFMWHSFLSSSVTSVAQDKLTEFTARTAADPASSPYQVHLMRCKISNEFEK